MARALESHKTLRLGSRWCRPEEWIRLPICFHCQKPGHLASECKEAEARVGRICRRCGGTNHLVKDCAADKAKCYVCSTEGHRADSMACPSYRKRVAELRASRGGNRGLSQVAGEGEGSGVSGRAVGPTQRRRTVITVPDADGGGDWTIQGRGITRA